MKDHELTIDRDRLLASTEKKPKPKSVGMLLLTPFPNGGWTISEQPHSHAMVPEQFGAYTNTDDMLAALSEMLKPTSD